MQQINVYNINFHKKWINYVQKDTPQLPTRLRHLDNTDRRKTPVQNTKSTFPLRAIDKQHSMNHLSTPVRSRRRAPRDRKEGLPSRIKVHKELQRQSG